MFFIKKVESSLLEAVDKQQVVLKTTNEDLIQKLRLIHFEEYDLKVLKTIQPIVEENMPMLVRKFYDTIMIVPELEEMIETYSSVERCNRQVK